MIRTRILPTSRLRRGFTLIELLVVISIIAVLASLIAPAVQSARRTARKLQCLNNIRQLGIAMQAFASTSGGQLPSLTSDIPISNTDGSGYIYGAGWPIALLPALDATNVLKNIKAHAKLLDVAGTNPGSFTVNTGGAAMAMANGTTFPSPGENVWLPVFTCPDDTTSDRQSGGLSYVVNAGFIPDRIWGFGLNSAATVPAEIQTPINRTFTPGADGGPFLQPFIVDWNKNNRRSFDGNTTVGVGFDLQDQAIQVSSGVYSRPTAGAGSSSFVSSIDYVSNGDGTTTTLMLAENLQAGPWNGTLCDNAVTGIGTSTRYFGVNHLGFGFRLPVDVGWQVTANVLVAGTFNPGTSWTNKTINTDAWLINNNLTAQPASAPRPSSQHAGGVNVIMCDGSGRFLNESLDSTVYLKLITSNGQTFSENTLDSLSY